jgi:hypothetical protein
MVVYILIRLRRAVLGGWLCCCVERKEEDVVRGRCAMKMQWRVGVGIEVEVICSWSSEE